ncbi:MAG: tetratricopeptide repeat protein [Planctomycetes bacterium]|nr:tetratricopeptide repeat protein [Planctomycetota bacterium]
MADGQGGRKACGSAVEAAGHGGGGRRGGVGAEALQYGVLLLACVAAYANTFGNDYVYDDVEAIRQNPIVLGPLQLGRIFRTPYPNDQVGANSYRPLTVLSFWIDHHLGEGAVGQFHFTNLLLHGLATCLVATLVAWVVGPGWTAFAASLLFAVHPVHTEAVTGIVGRSEVLATVLGLGALRLGLAERRGVAGVATRVGGGLLFGFALLAKESVVTLPALAVLCAAWRSRRLLGEGLALVRDDAPASAPRSAAAPAAAGAADAQRASLAAAVVPAIALVAYLALRVTVLGVPTMGFHFFTANHLGTRDRLLTMAEVLADYARLLVVPWPLSADYAFNFHPAMLRDRSWGPALLGAPLLAVLAWAACAGWRRREEGGLGIGWFFVGLAPFSNLILEIGMVKAERFLYWSSVGGCLALAWGLAAAARGLVGRWVALPEGEPQGPSSTSARGAGGPSEGVGAPQGPGVVATAGLAVVCVLFLGLTLRRNGDWKDGLTLFADLAERQPEDPMARAGLGAELIGRGRVEEGIQEAQEALRLRPDFVHGMLVLAQGLEAQGRAAEAVGALAGAIELDLTPRSRVYRASLLVSIGRGPEASSDLEGVLREYPENADAGSLLGLLELQGGRAVEALARLDRVVARAPGHAQARYHRGLALAQLGRADEALREFDLAVEAEPGIAPARFEACRVRIRLGRELDRAIRDLERLIGEAPPFLPQAYECLVRARSLRGDPEGAARARAEARRRGIEVPPAPVGDGGAAPGGS